MIIQLLYSLTVEDQNLKFDTAVDSSGNVILKGQPFNMSMNTQAEDNNRG